MSRQNPLLLCAPSIGMRCSAHTEPGGWVFGVSGWRIVVDRDLCQGHGVCESEAPGVFEVSKDGVLTVLQDVAARQRARHAVEAAVKYCPTHALTIVEDET